MKQGCRKRQGKVQSLAFDGRFMVYVINKDRFWPILSLVGMWRKVIK